MTPPSQPQGTRQEFRGVSHVLLDIEGTTCPVDFVAGTLFPYASAHLGDFLHNRREDPTVKLLAAEVEASWRADPHPQAQELRRCTGGTESSTSPEAVLPYLQWLIHQDRKLTPLKELQGMVWAEGYGRGELLAPLFPDVAESLRHWHGKGWILAVYSSGSVPAQQLLYGFSNGGDLRPLFMHWFDTRSGAKQNSESYLAIATAMAVHPTSVLFVSDAVAELDAAAAAQMQVVCSVREGNPQRDSGSHPSITSFDQLQLIS